MAIKLKVLLPDGSIKKYPSDSKRDIKDGKLSIVDATGLEIASYAKGDWTAVGRMRVATETADDE